MSSLSKSKTPRTSGSVVPKFSTSAEARRFSDQLEDMVTFLECWDHKLFSLSEMRQLVNPNTRLSVGELRSLIETKKSLLSRPSIPALSIDKEAAEEDDEDSKQSMPEQHTKKPKHRRRPSAKGTSELTSGVSLTTNNEYDSCGSNNSSSSSNSNSSAEITGDRSREFTPPFQFARNGRVVKNTLKLDEQGERSRHKRAAEFTYTANPKAAGSSGITDDGQSSYSYYRSQKSEQSSESSSGTASSTDEMGLSASAVASLVSAGKSTADSKGFGLAIENHSISSSMKSRRTGGKPQTTSVILGPSSNLATVVEELEEAGEDAAERDGLFLEETVDYDTPSDLDSNDSVIIKEETLIERHITAQQLEEDSDDAWEL